MKYLVEEKALCRAGILVCDPDCLCVIFSFIRDEQPGVGWVVGRREECKGGECMCVYVCECRGWAVGTRAFGFNGNGK